MSGLRRTRALLSSSQAGVIAGLVDQTATSLGSFLVSIGAARSGSVDSFGTFVLVQTLVLFAVGISRSTIGSSIITSPARSHGRAKDSLPGALGSASVIWLCAFAVLAALSIPNWKGDSLCLLWGAALAPLLWLDVVRYSLHSRGRHISAAGLGCSQLVVISIVLIALDIRGIATPGAVVVAYGSATMLICVIVAAALRVHPLAMRRAAAFMSAERVVWRGYSANYLVDATAGVSLPFVVGASGGIATAAGLRACQAVVGLPSQIPHGLSVFVLGRGAEDIATKGSLSPNWWRIWAGGHVALFGTAAAATLLITDELGSAVLGETWSVARSGLPFLLIAALFASLTMWRDMEHRIYGTSGRMAKVKLINVPISLGLAAVGAGVAGTAGASLGLAIAGLILFAFSWHVRPVPREGIGGRAPKSALDPAEPPQPALVPHVGEGSHSYP